MNVLVTGGAGYIGSVVVEQLIGAGESVVVFDNLSLGHSAAVHSSVVFIKGDLSGRAAIDAALSEHRFDAVIHFASRTLVDCSETQLRDRLMPGVGHPSPPASAYYP